MRKNSCGDAESAPYLAAGVFSIIIGMLAVGVFAVGDSYDISLMMYAGVAIFIPSFLVTAFSWIHSLVWTVSRIFNKRDD